MITVHQFAPALGLPNASPFCMKLETWLRLAGLQYRLDNRGDVLRAPKGKLPWVDDDGSVVSDTSFIIEHLRQRYRVSLDDGLSVQQQAQALAFQRLFEENLYWAVVHTRWVDDAGWALTRQAFFGAMPLPLRWLVPPLARRGIKAELRGHGMGRHGADEIHAIAARDLSAVADFLGDKTFFLDAQPRSIDTVAFAFLANVLWAPVDSPIQRHARTRPNLQAYCERMRARCFPEMPAR